MGLINYILSVITNTILYFLINCINVYLYIGKLVYNKIKFNIYLEKIENNVYKYVVNVDNKNYIINLFEPLKINTTKEDCKEIIENRNLITHCCLIDTLDNYLLDITEDFRKFSFYFTKDMEVNMDCTTKLVGDVFEFLKKDMDINYKCNKNIVEKLKELRALKSLKLILSINNKELSDLSFVL